MELFCRTNIVLVIKRRALKEECKLLRANYDILRLENENLRHTLALLQRTIYGPKSEKTGPDKSPQAAEGETFNEAEAGAGEAEAEGEEEESKEGGTIEGQAVKRKGHGKGGRRPLPANFPRQEIIHDLPEPEKICECGCQLTRIGEEKSEQLDRVPEHLRVLVHVRYKYACKSCEDTIKTAPVPVKPLPKAIATASLLAHMLVSKYADHLPLYRQSGMLARLDIDIPRSTMCNWVVACGELLSPLVECLRADIVASDYVASDETHLQVLENKGKSYMWVHMTGHGGKRAVVYDYHDSREAVCANEFLKGFEGFHQSDAYSGYTALHALKLVIWVACWAHARRKFEEITKALKRSGKKHPPGIAHHMMELIGKLYKVERKILDEKYDPEQTKAYRAEHAVPILAEIKAYLDANKDQVPPQSPIGKAMAYTLNQWEGLQTYLQDGRLRIDNNGVERMMKCFATGRKNWMFSATEHGAKASAMIFSLIETCKANGINPLHYLHTVLDKIRHCNGKEELRAMLPYNIDKKLLVHA